MQPSRIEIGGLASTVGANLTRIGEVIIFVRDNVDQLPSWALDLGGISAAELEADAKRLSEQYEGLIKNIENVGRVELQTFLFDSIFKIKQWKGVLASKACQIDADDQFLSAIYAAQELQNNLKEIPTVSVLDRHRKPSEEQEDIPEIMERLRHVYTPLSELAYLIKESGGQDALTKSSIELLRVIAWQGELRKHSLREVQGANFSKMKLIDVIISIECLLSNLPTVDLFSTQIKDSAKLYEEMTLIRKELEKKISPKDGLSGISLAENHIESINYSNLKASVL